MWSTVELREIRVFLALCDELHFGRTAERMHVTPTVDHIDRKSTRLNSSHSQISYAVFCLKKKTTYNARRLPQPNTAPLKLLQISAHRILPRNDRHRRRTLLYRTCNPHPPCDLQ